MLQFQPAVDPAPDRRDPPHVGEGQTLAQIRADRVPPDHHGHAAVLRDLPVFLVRDQHMRQILHRGRHLIDADHKPVAHRADAGEPLAGDGLDPAVVAPPEGVDQPPGHRFGSCHILGQRHHRLHIIGYAMPRILDGKTHCNSTANQPPSHNVHTPPSDAIRRITQSGPNDVPSPSTAAGRRPAHPVIPTPTPPPCRGDGETNRKPIGRSTFPRSRRTRHRSRTDAPGYVPTARGAPVGTAAAAVQPAVAASAHGRTALPGQQSPRDRIYDPPRTTARLHRNRPSAVRPAPPRGHAAPPPLSRASRAPGAPAPTRPGCSPASTGS